MCDTLSNKHSNRNVCHDVSPCIFPTKEDLDMTSSPPGQDICGNLNFSFRSVELLQKIINPYEDIQARINSFKNWPTSSKQKPENLADAGFYYKGIDDKTVCFKCCGPLNNWEDDDEPWEQHALWYPKCQFVLAVKGQEFVSFVAKKFKNFVPNWDLTIEKDGPKSLGVTDDDKMCIICCNNQREVIFVPCGHNWTCLRCMNSLEDKKCPICREQIIQIKTF